MTASKLFGKLDKFKSLSAYRKLYPYIRKYPGRTLMALLVTVPVGSLDAAIAWILRPYMDTVMIGKSQSGATLFPALIVVFAVVQSLLSYASNYLNTWVGQKVAMNVKLDLYQKLLYRETAFFDTSTSGEVIFRFNTDVDAACSGFLTTFRSFMVQLFSSFALVCVLFYNSATLASIALFILVVAVVPLKNVRKKLRGVFEKSLSVGSNILSNYTETFSGNRVVTAYNLQDHMLDRMKRTLNGMFGVSIKVVQRTCSLSLFMHFVTAVGIAITVWLQSYLITTGKMTPGNFVSFITALLMLYTPIKKMGGNVNAIQLSIMALERVFDKMSEEPKIQNKPEAARVVGFRDAITYENVDFSYVPDRRVLNNINLEIKRGKTVAFVGNSGGGKTTLVNLLPRFYDVKAGRVAIDGVDVRDMTLESLRDLIAVVFQDNFLFSGTIMENIALGRAGSTREEVMEAAEAACLKEFIDSLPQGLDTEVGERGILLSGGQKQRVAIARAFVKKAPIVILDEATSALDTKSEAIVQEAIDNLMHDRTVLVIAHRLSTVMHADTIVVVNHGEIAEIGTHESLSAMENGIYHGLYETQFK